MDAPVLRPAPAVARHQRHVRNYLINPRFQLKYTSFLVGLTIAFSLALGGALWRTGNEALMLSRTAVDKAMQTVSRGQDLVRENQKVSTMARMTIDRAYADQPELGRVFADEDLKRAEALRGEQARLEGDAQRLRAQAEGLEAKQSALMGLLVAGLAALVLFIGVVGIVITHKVAGPIFKMKRQLREVGDGSLRRPGKLRRGDELVDFFEAFEDMVDRLRTRQKAEIGRVDAILGALDRNDGPSAVVTLRALRDEMQAHLD
ncbi:MAG: methyl-accepting chemotaxis protein [Polyangiaceae bacterium]|jgi:nitrogen fixation/metabolism regulation signal transduction histidine kinase|nr:methyl-accepting chemotaxis protein [Polyangiaceae bacterium]